MSLVSPPSYENELTSERKLKISSFYFIAETPNQSSF